MSNYQGIAAQLYVWSQVYGQKGKSIPDHLDTVLGEVAAAGFDGFEGDLGLVGTPEQRDALAQLLDKYSLKLASLYSGGNFHERDHAPQTIEQLLPMAEHAAALGCPGITVNPNAIGRDKTDEELVIQGEYLDAFGRELRNLGLFLACHNHTPEIRNNAREFRAICAYTTPIFVGMCVDVHWVLRGGEAPLPLMRECPDRIKSIHLRNSRDGIWTEAFGDGDIDHTEVHDFFQEVGYQGWLVVELAYEAETEITRPLVENARLSCDYARRLFQQVDA